MKSLKKLTALSLAAISLLTLTACAPKTDDPKDSPDPNTEKKETITLGTSADFAPFEFHKLIDGKDTILGADIALAQKIADDMGKELVIVDMDFDFLLTKLGDDTIDFVIASINPSPEREKQADFTDRYYSSKQVALIKKDMADEYTTIESLSTKNIAGQAGSIQATYLAEFYPDANHVILKDVPNEVAQLKAGKVDAVLLENEVAQGFAKANDDLMVADFVITESTGAAVAVKKGNTALIEEINKSLAEVNKDSLYLKYLEEATAQNDAK